MPSYFWRVLISFDQFVNVVFGPVLNFILRVDGFGYPDETLSSVFGKYSEVCKTCKFICKLLHLFDKEHCEKSIEYDEGKNVRS